MKVASANILGSLNDQQAAIRVRQMLAHEPTILGLQEWRPGRASLLRDHGHVFRYPRGARRYPRSGYVFAYPQRGGQPIGVDAEWGWIVYARELTLVPAGKGLRATDATEALVQDRSGTIHACLNTHLMAHHDRPENREAWRDGVRAIRAWAVSWDGYERWVMADVNKHLLDMPPLVSCWDGNKVQATFRGRTIDGVWGNRRAARVRVVDFEGRDHDGVAATYREGEGR